jgi:MFS family permease
LTTPNLEPFLSQPKRGIPKTVKGLSVVSLFNDFASEMIYPLLPAFVTRTLGGSATYLGLLDGAAELTSALVKLVSGRLADRPGWKKPLILGGYLSAVLIRPLMAITSAAWQVIGFRVLDRVGKGLRTPARDSLIADVTAAEVRGRAYGFHRGADHLGAVFGSLAAWWLLRSHVDVRDVLTWSLVPGLVAFLVLVFVLRSPPPKDAPPTIGSSAPAEGGQVFWTPVLVLAALTFFRLPEALLLLRLQDLGVSVVMIPLVWAGLHVVRTVASYPGGWITDRIGPRLTILAGGIVAAGIAVLLGFEITAPMAIAGFLGFGLVAGLMESPERVLVTRLAPRRTGRAFGAYHAVTGVAALPAGLLFGWLFQHHGGGTALWVSAAAMGVALVAWTAIRMDVGGGQAE